jgi:hypothetical protein
MQPGGVHPVILVTQPAYPELVEGLLSFCCGTRGLKNKDSASTSAAWTVLGFGGKCSRVEFLR